MGVKPADVIGKCLGLGLFVTINQRLDFETIEMVADEFNFEAVLMAEYATDPIISSYEWRYYDFKIE